jgi:hypothetical protein
MHMHVNGMDILPWLMWPCEVHDMAHVPMVGGLVPTC